MTESARPITASRLVRAPAGRVFDYLAQPENHRDFDTSGMVRGALDRMRIEAGTVFTMIMHNDIEGDHHVENHLVVFEPGRAIGWSPAAPGEAPAGHTWTWRLAPDGTGRTVVSQLARVSGPDRVAGVAALDDPVGRVLPRPHADL